MSEYIAKASIEPRDYRVVFLMQKADNRIYLRIIDSASVHPAL